MHQIDRNTGDIDCKQSAPAELIYAHKQCRRVHDPAVDHKGDQKAIYGQLQPFCRQDPQSVEDTG